GTINPDTNKIPKHLFQGYLNIYNNYFKAPWMPDRTEANPNELNQDDARYGFRCCHLKNIWTAPLPPETELSRQMTTSTTSDRKSGSAGMPRPISYAVFCLKKKKVILIRTRNQYRQGLHPPSATPLQLPSS